MASKIDSLQEQLEKCRENNDKLNEDLQALRKQLEQERQGKEVVSKQDYENLKKQLAEAVFKKKLFEDSSERYQKQLAECRSQDKQKEIDELKLQLQELKQRLSRPHLQGGRRISVSDDEIIKLRQEGNTVKAISEQLEIGTSTVNRILKDHNIRVLKVYNNDDDTN